MSLIRVSQPVKYPTQQDVLDPSFISNYGRPAGLWTPTYGGANIAYDFSGNGKNGTLNGGVTVVPGGFGVLGQGWHGDGSTGRIAFQNFSVPGDFTMVCAFTPYSITTADRAVFAFDNYPASPRFSCLAKSNTGSNNLPSVESEINGTGTLVSLAAWTSSPRVLFLVRSGTALKVYDNQTSTVSASIVVGSGAMTFYNGGLFSHYYSGAASEFSATDVDFFAVFSSAFSPSQVSSLYAALMYGVP